MAILFPGQRLRWPFCDASISDYQLLKLILDFLLVDFLLFLIKARSPRVSFRVGFVLATGCKAVGHAAATGHFPKHPASTAHRRYGKYSLPAMKTALVRNTGKWSVLCMLTKRLRTVHRLNVTKYEAA